MRDQHGWDGAAYDRWLNEGSDGGHECDRFPECETCGTEGRVLLPVDPEDLPDGEHASCKAACGTCGEDCEDCAGTGYRCPCSPGYAEDFPEPDYDDDGF